MQEVLAPALLTAVAATVWSTAHKPESTTDRLIQGVFLVSGVCTSVGVAGALVVRHPVVAVAAAVGGVGLHVVAKVLFPRRSARALMLQALSLMLVALVLASVGL
jgi:hypothetical protein